MQQYFWHVYQYMELVCVCVEDLITLSWCYWKVVAPLASEPQRQEIDAL